MKRDLPAFVYRRTRGKYSYLYFERAGESTRIKADAGTPAFAVEYAKLMIGTNETAGNGTFAALIASYKRAERFTRLKPRTKADYEGVLTYLASKIGTLPVSAIRRKDVIRIQASNAVRVRFANYTVQVLSVLLEHSIDIGLRDDNPAKGVSLIKSTKPARQPWPDGLIAKARENATGRTLLIFELCLGTGQRIGDVLRMRWDDLQDGGINVRQGKTGQPLWVPLTAPLRAALDATPKAGLTICAWGRRGHATSYRGAADMVMKLRAKIGAESFDLHSLRHTTASELAQAGCSDEVIQAITGHKTAAMVRLYTASTRQKARAQLAQGMRDTKENE